MESYFIIKVGPVNKEPNLPVKQRETQHNLFLFLMGFICGSAD